MSSTGVARPPSALQRRDSGGSMTERTFRSPSPNRASEAVPPDADAPPVPSLPPQIPAKSIRRPASVEPPQRILSPPPKPHGRGMSLDRGPGALANMQPAQKKPPVPALRTVEDPNSARKRDSVNFSRPMSPTNSPQGSPATRQPTVPKDIGQGQTTRSPLNANVPAKKKKTATKATTESKPNTPPTNNTALNPVDFTPMKQTPSTGTTQPQAISPQQTANTGAGTPVTPKKKKKKANVPPPGSDLSASYPSDSESETSERSTTSEGPRSYNTRAAGMLAKRPSVVREDREAEEEEDGSSYSQKLGPTLQNGDTIPKSKAKPARSPVSGQSHGRSASQPVNATKAAKTSSLGVPNGGIQGAAGESDVGFGSNRPQSLSPARSAHFSVKPITEGEKHQPPGRSVSPAKSALKHSPSRGPSPIGGTQFGTNRKLGPGSEASDRSSVVSEDGKLVSRPKKSVRVSFDEDSVVLGRAATPPTDTDSPIITSPQNKESTSRRWFGGNRDRKDSSDADGVIQPTPVLPSFGSIRRQKAEDGGGNEREGTGFANDEKIGAILSRVFNDQGKESDIAARNQLVTEDPLPPQVTSVGGSGERSDSEYSTQEISHEAQASDKPQVTLPSSLVEEHATPLDGKTGAIQDVPHIAVQPATPGLGEVKSESKDYVNVSNPSVSTVEHTSTEPTPAGLGIAEPTPGTNHAKDDPDLPVVGHVSDSLGKQIDPDSDSDDSAVFSDAAEDMSDLEGDGFGSINAIVESPASASSPFPKQGGPSSPTPRGTKEREAPQSSPLAKEINPMSSPSSDAEWDKAQSYWSEVNQSRKEQKEAEVVQAPAAETAPPKKKTKKKKTQSAQEPTQPPLPPWPDRQYQEDIAHSVSSNAAATKKSVRPKSAVAPEKNPMPSAMRNPVPPKSAMKQSSSPISGPTGATSGALQKKSRPLSSAPTVEATNKPSKSSHNRISSLESSQAPVPPKTKKTGKPKSKPMLTRNDSDSSSSFRRVRSKTPDNGRYTMKRSMRGDSASDRPSSAFSGPPTSMSQGGGRRPMSVSGVPTMRTSLRGSVDIKPSRTSLRPSVDSKAEGTKSPSRFPGFGKKSKQAPPSAAGSRFSSRFDDSSDDDDGPSFALSRFEDSSDEDEQEGLAPVRGIPRRIDEGDSTDLEDSSADERQKAPAKKPDPVHPATAAEGSALNTGSLRVEPEKKEKEKKKRPFFSRIGSKRKETSPVPAQLSTPGKAMEPATPQNRPMESPATNAATAAAAASPKSPKLQRRVTADRVASLQAKPSNTTSPNSPTLALEQARKADPSSWPLPAGPSTAAIQGRPSTSDGTRARKNFGGGLGQREAGKGKRPEMGSRRATVDEEGNILSAKTGKKKRFQGLRRFVGLHD